VSVDRRYILSDLNEENDCSFDFGTTRITFLVTGFGVTIGFILADENERPLPGPI
jgi:hypothetical protein